MHYPKKSGVRILPDPRRADDQDVQSRGRESWAAGGRLSCPYPNSCACWCNSLCAIRVY